MPSPYRLLAKALSVLIVLIAGCFPLLLWRYGFEVADTGWHAVLTRDFFHRPDLVANAAPWYLTWAVGAVGAWFGMIGGTDSWLTLRQIGFLPYAASSIITAAMAWRLHASKFEATVGVLCVSLVSYTCFSVSQLNYNSLSAAISCVALAFAISAAMARKSDIRLVLAGVFVALAAGSRLPSALTIVPVLFLIWIRYEKAHLGLATLKVICGVGLGILIIGLVVLCAGHLEKLLKGLLDFLRSSYAGPASSDQTSWPSSGVALGWLRTLQSALLLPVFVTLLMGFVRRKMQPVLWIYWALAVGLVLVVAWRATPTRDANLYNTLPLLIVGLTLLEIDPKARTMKNPVLLVAATGLLFALTFSFGSANGFRNSLMAYWFVFPFLPQLVHDVGGHRVITCMLIILSAVAAHRLTHPYSDQGIGTLQCRFAIAPLRGVASQCSRVEQTEGVVKAITENSTPADAIFVAQNSPALYVLAQRSVWGNSPWPYLDSSHDIERWFAESGSSPRLIVLDKMNLAGGREWPNIYNGEPRQHVSGLKRHWPIYTAYLTTHNYHLVFENVLWQVYAKDDFK